MIETGDQTLIKKMNKSQVLNIVKGEGPISRAQVALTTGLTKGTVSSLVSELIEENIIHELGPGPSSGGRRPVLLQFNHQAGFAIGVDIGVNYILVVLTDLSGNIVLEQSRKVVNQAFDEVLEITIEAIDYMFNHAPKSPYGIVGIGIGVAGIVDREGEILFAPNLQWRKVNIKKPLMKQFDVPVIVDNEANAGATGEKQFGAGKDASSLLYLSVGVGIGAGIIIDDQLFRGTTALSGEVGHFSIEREGLLCSCGNRGCWELYASEKALLHMSKERFNQSEAMNLEGFIDLANQQNSKAIHLFTEIGYNLGMGLANLINTFNPELILIGNRMSKAQQWLEQPINQTIQQRALPYHLQHVKVAFSHLQVNSTSLGAASFAIDGFFTKLKEKSPVV